jgi:FkbM family methyltransferase
MNDLGDKGSPTLYRRFRALVRRVIYAVRPEIWLWLMAAKNRRAERIAWDQRVADTVASPDNARIPRVKGAGSVTGGYQVMHNGLKVNTHGYYGEKNTRLLKLNRGCHEPQEEVVFAAVIASLAPGATMIECGAYWGFYSMWFLSAVKSARAYLIEPAPVNLRVGQENFRLNGFTGDFTQAYVGREKGVYADGVAILNMDTFAAEHGLDRIDILHADIQGAELDMLNGARGLLERRVVRYLFVSTHSMELHGECRKLLTSTGYVELASVNLQESYSADGILVFHSPDVKAPAVAHPAPRPAAGWTEKQPPGLWKAQ